MFELSLRLKKFPIREAQKELEQLHSLSEEEFKEHVTQKRSDILEFHRAQNACYQNIVGDISINDWGDVPVMTKGDLQQPLKDRLSKGYSLNSVYVNKTSGSSGHPFVFAKDRFSHAMTWAVIMDRYQWYGLDFHNSYQARFYGIPLDRVGYTKERVKDKLSKRYRFPIFDLSDEVLTEYLEVFKKKAFDHLYGYTSSIVLFAKFLHSRQLNLKSICPTIKYCITTSEMLYDQDKELMESVFGVPVINEYGASELDLIAFTDQEGQFALNSETLFVEIADEDGRPLPDGSEGRILITSLYNKAHPMIRYDIGDTGVIEREGRWKKPVLKKLIGRTNDVAVLPGGKKVPGLTFYYVTKSIIEDDSKVKEFVIDQLEPDLFNIRYASSEPLTESEIGRIKEALVKYVGGDLRLEFSREEVIKRTKSGKLKQFSSKIIDN